MSVTATICTKDRYFTTLPLTIMAVINQNRLPEKLVIFDDGEHKDLRQHPIYSHLFWLLNHKGINWEWKFAPNCGQTKCHQMALDHATTDFIWRLDDDVIPEKDVLENLLSHINYGNIGAVGSKILIPGQNEEQFQKSFGSIENIFSSPSPQWCKNDIWQETEHLHCSFLYRVSAAKEKGYPSHLSIIGHREETIFTHNIFLSGYKLIFTPECVTWHMRNPQGGIRSFTDDNLWKSDEYKFRKYLETKNKTTAKVIVLDNGLGDHYAFKSILPKILEKTPKLTLAVCFPEAFDFTPVKLISIADAIDSGLSMDNFNIYKWMWDRNWKGTLVEAFEKRYL